MKNPLAITAIGAFTGLVYITIVVYIFGVEGKFDATLYLLSSLWITAGVAWYLTIRGHRRIVPN